MKLHESQRNKLAEQICARWIARRQIRIRKPKVYLIVHSNREAAVWGWCHHRGQPFITLHVGPKANKRDMYIVLAHEFAHTLDYQTTKGKWKNERLPHGERFQRLLWRTLPKGLWKRASGTRYSIGQSRHRPEFQPIDNNMEVAA